MTNIEQMIQNLCPNGVEFKKLGEVAEIDTGNRNRQDAVEDGQYPFYVRSKEIFRIDSYSYDEEAIIIPGEGGIGDIFHYVNGKYDLHQRAYRIHLTNKAVDTKFVYFYLTAHFKDYIIGKAVAATVTSIRKPMLQAFEIPVPPLEIQKKIVECLDKFSALAAELQAELQMRRKQYEYYRTHLLTPHSDCNSANNTDDCNWEWKTLGEICEVQDYVANGSFGDIKKNVQYYNEPNYALLVRITDLTNNFQNSQKVYIDEHAYNYMTKSRLEGDEIIISNVGSCGATFLCPKLDMPMSLAPNAILVRTPNNHFYYHWFCSKFGQEAINKIVAKSAMPKFNKTEFRKIQLPFPPLAEQERIVSILDKFEALTTSLSDGIPAEQIRQQKRYEYYRDLLLTFDRKAE